MINGKVKGFIIFYSEYRSEAVTRNHKVVPAVPICPCGKTPLRCPHPDNCQMEDL